VAKKMVFLLLNLLYIKFSEKKIIQNSPFCKRKLMNVPSFSLPKRTKKKITTAYKLCIEMKFRYREGMGRGKG